MFNKKGMFPFYNWNVKYILKIEIFINKGCFPFKTELLHL